MNRLTVDTGEMTDVWPGRLVTWLHVPRGGYGYACPVDAVVVRNGTRPATWVVIQVARRDGSLVFRRVDVTRLRERVEYVRPYDLKEPTK